VLGDVDGQIPVDGRRDEHLLRVRGQGNQLLPPLGVEFGEDIVENEHRIRPVAPQQRELREPQRDRVTPRLPVGGEPLRRRLPQVEQQIVAVRPDQ
jgi:hypothetical protein